MFRVFLARADIFPPGSLLPVAPGNVTILLHPTMLGNALPAVEPPRPDPRPAKVERSNTAKSSKILRPPNAFILYRKAHHEAVKAAHPGIHNNQICKFLFLTSVIHVNISIAVILGTQWQQEDAAVRAQYKAQAVQLKQEHMMKYPDYQYQPRKTSELKRRMTKKKAAALNQNEAPNQNIFGIGSLPSDHDFSRVSGKWSDSNGADDTNPPNVMPGYNTAALFDQVHLHNSQQELNQDLEESLPEVFAGDNQYAELVSPEDYNIPWQAIEKHYLGSGNDDVFEEFINSGIWAGTGTST